MNDVRNIIKYQGCISELVAKNRAFYPLNNIKVKPTIERLWYREGNQPTHDIGISFFGKSGYGKSTTINSIIGKKVMETSPVEACTKVIQSAEYMLTDGNYLTFTDLPGLGESNEEEEKYIDWYRAMLEKSDAIVYFLRADCRDFSVDEMIFKELFESKNSRSKVVVALNCCDKIEPLDRTTRCGPSPVQMEKIRQKYSCLKSGIFKSSTLIPCCGTPAWNHDDLISSVVQTLLISINNE